MSCYLFCSIEHYQSIYAASLTSIEDVKSPVAIHSPDGAEVLIRGLGDLTQSQAQAYMAKHWDTGPVAV